MIGISRIECISSRFFMTNEKMELIFVYLSLHPENNFQAMERVPFCVGADIPKAGSLFPRC